MGVAGTPAQAKQKALDGHLALAADHNKELKKFVACYEKAPTTGNPHLHVIICTSVPPYDTKNEAFFDLPLGPGGANVHPNIKAISMSAKVINDCVLYQCKEDASPLFYGCSLEDIIRGGPNDYIKRSRDTEAWLTSVRRGTYKTPFPFTLPKPAGDVAARIVPRPNEADKRCCYWIVGAPDWGKTRWVEDTFQGKKIYKRPSRQHYPYDEYEGQQVIILDDTMPGRNELIDMTGYYKTETAVFGDTRYYSRKMPMEQRNVMIVLHNELPCEDGDTEKWPKYTVNDPWFKSRVNIIDLR